MINIEPLDATEILDAMSNIIKETIISNISGGIYANIKSDEKYRSTIVLIDTRVNNHYLGSISLIIRGNRKFVCLKTSPLESDTELFVAEIEYNTRTIIVNESRHSYLAISDIDDWFHKLGDRLKAKIVWSTDKQKSNNTNKGADVKMKKPNKKKHTAIMEEYGIDDVFFNLPKKVTTVVFTDGTISVVKCHKNEKFSCEIGLCQAITRHMLGGKRSNITRIVKKGTKRSARRNRIIAAKIKRKEEENK